ncbi:hypothetical protein GCM10020220_076980 [Nonomuraea rubra]
MSSASLLSPSRNPAPRGTPQWTGTLAPSGMRTQAHARTNIILNCPTAWDKADA